MNNWFNISNVAVIRFISKMIKKTVITTFVQRKIKIQVHPA